MIKRIYSLNCLPEQGVEVQKIRALWLAYGGEYDFCRFYSSENAIFCLFNRDVVLYSDESCNYEELAEFLSFCGVNEIFCSDYAGQELATHLNYELDYVNLMEYNGTPVSCVTDKSPPLSEVFEVIKKSFGLSSDCFEQWYLDMSHRIRHNISEVRMLDSSVLVVQHNLNEEVLLSQIATLPEQQRKGSASRLISAVCDEFPDKSIMLICSDELVGFYSKIGFELKGKKCNLISKA